MDLAVNSRELNSVTNAINRQGVCLKKRTILEVQLAEGLILLQEEFPVGFNRTTAIDVVAGEVSSDRRIFYLFECKRAYAERKKWIFFRDSESSFRTCRGVGQFGTFSIPSLGTAMSDQFAVCSEGYELEEKRFENGKCTDLVADQDPIYKACNQLSEGYLGFVKHRHLSRSIPKESDLLTVDLIVPVLVTTAPLFVADMDPEKVSPSTGNLRENIQTEEFPWLVLKCPYASTPNGDDEMDFRNAQSIVDARDEWQRHRESLYIVNSSKLGDFFRGQIRQFYVGIKIP